MGFLPVHTVVGELVGRQEFRLERAEHNGRKLDWLRWLELVTRSYIVGAAGIPRGSSKRLGFLLNQL